MKNQAISTNRSNFSLRTYLATRLKKKKTGLSQTILSDLKISANSSVMNTKKPKTVLKPIRRCGFKEIKSGNGPGWPLAITSLMTPKKRSRESTNRKLRSANGR